MRDTFDMYTRVLAGHPDAFITRRDDIDAAITLELVTVRGHYMNGRRADPPGRGGILAMHLQRARRCDEAGAGGRERDCHRLPADGAGTRRCGCPRAGAGLSEVRAAVGEEGGRRPG